jgi:MSHA biogenesis protein MshO
MARVGLKKNKHSGFTLVELVVVIILTGILSTVMFQFITVPMESYVDVGRRTRLVDIADTAIQRIAYDVRAALPNSIRIGCAGKCMEFLRAPAGGRYRADPPGDGLNFISDSRFDVIGPLDYSGFTTSNNATDCAANLASCVAIYNTGLSGTNAWNMDNMATLASGSSAADIRFTNFSFPQASPYQRFFLVDTPIKYICDTASGTETLRRYQNYNIVSNETAVDSHAELLALSNPAEHSLLADQVTGCNFSYSSGTAERNAVLTISLTVSEFDHLSNVTEDITLLHQVSVVNLP